MRIEHTITFAGDEIADIAFVPKYYDGHVFATEVTVSIRLAESGRPYVYRVDIDAVKAKKDGTRSKVALAPIWHSRESLGVLPLHIGDLADQAVDYIDDLMRGVV
jgi:hypothetical protein